jgi:hypothetical protein
MGVKRFLTLMKEHRLRVFENKVLSRIFGPKKNEVTGGGENCVKRKYMIRTLHPVKLE